MPRHHLVCVSGPFSEQVVRRAVGDVSSVYLCDAGYWLASLQQAVAQGQFSADKGVAHGIVHCSIAAMMDVTLEPVIVIVNFPCGGTVPAAASVRHFWAACPADGLPGQGVVPSSYDTLLCARDVGPTDQAVAQLAAHVMHAVHVSILEASAQQIPSPPTSQSSTATALAASPDEPIFPLAPSPQ